MTNFCKDRLESRKFKVYEFKKKIMVTVFKT